MRITLTEHLSEIPAETWDRLVGPGGNPFLRYAFLCGLEQHGCVGEVWGWLPHHLLAWEGEQLVGAVPLYLKTNSYGELVFDWSWADAWQRAGGRYYPKLVSAVPYTPATGPRLLSAPEADASAVRRALANGALDLARELGVSSLHWLFPDAEQTAELEAQGLYRRMGVQFHWHNAGYRDFDDFLDRFTAQKRKKLKRERRRVQEAGIIVETFSGYTATADHWRLFGEFYRDPFERYGGYATLNESFFRHVAEHMPENVVLVMARDGDRHVAGALSFRSGDTLYGRHWGCLADYDSLHFEACYYTGIEYCIREGLARFEPGAQGEHKVARGFEPTATWSAHWLADSGLAKAVQRFVQQERELLEDTMQELTGHLPFKQGPA